MKSKVIHLWVLTPLVALLSSPGKAQEIFTVKSVEASIHGTSTLHDWKSTITQIECKGYFLSEGPSLQAIKSIFVKIPVTGIKSKEGKIMDEKTYEAFKSETNPYIVFTADSAQVKIDLNQSVVITVSGNLTMAGKTRLIVLNASGWLLPNGDVSLSITRKLTMTSFNMKPPTAMFGTIKAGDEIEIRVDLVLTRPEAMKTNFK
jgi:polyisoprenoid-binding protein YceI